MTPEEERGALFTRVAGSWVQNDSDAALAWLTEHATGDDRDAALTRGADAIAYTDPEEALAWAGAIESQERQTQTASTVFEVIEGQSGREAAEAALRNSGIPEESINTILEGRGEPEATELLEATPSLPGEAHELEAAPPAARPVPGRSAARGRTFCKRNCSIP